MLTPNQYLIPNVNKQFIECQRFAVHGLQSDNITFTTAFCIFLWVFKE